MSTNPNPAPAGLSKRAATPIAGFALQNGTPQILTWTAPNDGQNHSVLLIFTIHVSSAETGGSVSFNFTAPDGGARTGFGLSGGNGGTGQVTTPSFPTYFTTGPGGVVTVNQDGALTVGAATIWVEIWAS